MMYNVTTYGKNLWLFELQRRMKSLKILFSAFVLVGLISVTSRADLVINYTDGSPSLGWPLPQPQGATQMAMLFTNPTANACTLKIVHAGLLDVPEVLNDTNGDLLFTIYSLNVDGNPDSVLYFESVPNSVFVGGFTKPLNVVSLDISTQALTFP